MHLARWACSAPALSFDKRGLSHSTAHRVGMLTHSCSLSLSHTLVCAAGVCSCTRRLMHSSARARLCFGRAPLPHNDRAAPDSVHTRAWPSFLVVGCLHSSVARQAVTLVWRQCGRLVSLVVTPRPTRVHHISRGLVGAAILCMSWWAIAGARREDAGHAALCAPHARSCSERALSSSRGLLAGPCG